MVRNLLFLKGRFPNLGNDLFAIYPSFFMSPKVSSAEICAFCIMPSKP